MMCYKEFKERLIQHITFKLRNCNIAENEDGTIYVRNNKEDRVGVTVRVASIYEDYTTHPYSINQMCEETVKKIEASLNNQIDSIEETIDAIENFSLVKDKLIVKPFNISERKVNTIGKAVYDLYLMVCILIEDTKDGIATIKPIDKLLNIWGITEDEAFKIALENSKKLFPEKIMRLSDALTPGLIPDDEKYPLDTVAVATTTRYINGAMAIFYDGVLKELSDRFDSDIYVLFTSKHEAMVHSVNCNASAEELQNVLVEVIKEATLPEDFLSYSIYRYYRKEERFERISTRKKNEFHYGTNVFC